MHERGVHARIRLERPGFTLDIDIDPRGGEVTALLGPNGSGKSTTLRVLAGLEAGQDDRITIAGRVVDDTASGDWIVPEHRRVGMVFQEYLLFPHLSALDNIAFGPRARGTGRMEAETRSREWLERLGIAELAGRPPRELSGGQAQRVALARALVTEPDLLLLDEPLAALDAGTRGELRTLLRRHLAGFDGATVMVTHDPIDAMVLADRVLVLEDGRIVQDGTPAEIAQRPATAYVAGLVGVNLLRGTAEAGTVHLASGLELRIADPRISGPVVVAVRPEAVSLHREHPEGSPRNVWRGSIEAVESRGDLVRVHVGGADPIAALVTPGAVAELGLHDGVEVWVSLKAAELQVYPG